MIYIFDFDNTVYRGTLILDIYRTLRKYLNLEDKIRTSVLGAIGAYFILTHKNFPLKLYSKIENIAKKYESLIEKITYHLLEKNVPKKVLEYLKILSQRYICIILTLEPSFITKYIKNFLERHGVKIKVLNVNSMDLKEKIVEGLKKKGYSVKYIDDKLEEKLAKALRFYIFR